MHCDVHDLAAASDGKCVLCRREERTQTSSRATWIVLGGFGALFAIVCVVGVAMRVSSIVSAMPAAATTVTVITHDAPAPAEPRANAPGADTTHAADLARAQAREQARASIPITVYSASWCPHCKRAKAWLAAQQLAYQEVDVEASPANARAMRAVNPRGGVPTIVIDGDVLVGFDQQDTQAAVDRAIDRRLPRGG